MNHDAYEELHRIACPTLVLMLCWFIEDLFQRRMRVEKAVVLFTCVLHTFLLLLHRTFGGFQLGARYAVDLIPYTIFYLLLTLQKKHINILEFGVLTAGFAFMFWASTVINL